MINIYKLIYKQKNIAINKNKDIVGTIDIEEIDGGINFILDLTECYVNKKYSIQLMYNDWKGKVAQLKVMDSYKRMELISMEIFNLISPRTYSDNNAAHWPDANIIKVFFNEDCSKISILLVQPNVKFSESILKKYLVISLDRDTKSGTEWMIEKNEHFRSVIEKRKIKTNVILNNDIYNSISYLEAQLDSVTKLLLKVIDKYNIDISNDTELSNAMSAVSEANKYSVLDIKPIDKILEEFNNKKQMRELQKKYYEEKNKLTESFNE